MPEAFTLDRTCVIRPAKTGFDVVCAIRHNLDSDYTKHDDNRQKFYQSVKIFLGIQADSKKGNHFYSSGGNQNKKIKVVKKKGY